MKNLTTVSLPGLESCGQQALQALLVENDENDALLTLRCLRKLCPAAAPIQVERATDGAEAITKLLARMFGVVLLDWNMPGIGGEEVLRTMREKGLRTPVVVLSGRFPKEIPVDLRSWGATFLSKNDLCVASLRAAIFGAMNLNQETILV